MEGKTLARIGAVIFVAVVITATAIEATRKDDVPAEARTSGASQPSPGYRSELVRCQRLGEAGTRDPACLQAWAENRERFLGVAPRHDAAPPTPPATPDTMMGKDADPASSPDTAEAR